MREVFLEESVTNRAGKREKLFYTLFNIFQYLSYVFAFGWFVIFLWQFNYSKEGILISTILLIVPTAIFIGSAILLGILKNKFCNEFDYTFVSGQLSVSKVINKKKRVDVFKVQTTELEKIGPYASKDFEKYSLNKENSIQYLTSNKIAEEGKSFYYVVFTLKDKKRICVLECTRQFISTMVGYVKSFVLDGELK